MQDTTSAASFLALALPWPTDHGPQFFVNIHRKRPVVIDGKVQTDAKGKTRWIFPGRATRSVSEAISFIQFTESKETADTYVCMSGQLPGKVKTNKRGQEYFGAARSIDGAVCMKGLWLDVDVKPNDPDHGYPSQEEAAAEFGRIRRAIGMPMPTVCVLSGSGGFHAHWSFEAAVEPAIWEPLAFALVAAFVEQGFKGDTGCTIDAARLLRVPGTWNHKQHDAGTGPKTPVRTLAQSGLTFPVTLIDHILAKWKGHTPHRARKAFQLLSGEVPEVMRGMVANDLSAGIETRPVPSIGDVAKGCPFIMRTLQTGGAANNNPLWLQTTNIALFTTEQRDAAHWMAMGHPDYSAVDTDFLWQRQLDTKLRRDMGWPRCATIQAQGAPECATCPRLAEGRSPLNFALSGNVVIDAIVADQADPVDPAAAAAMPELPSGFKYGPHGIVLVNYVDPEDDGRIVSEPLCAFPLLNPWMQDHPASINFTTVTAGVLGTPTAYERQIKVPMELMHDLSAMGKLLAGQHMVLPPDKVHAFRGFLVSWIEKLRQQRENVIQNVPFGWSRADGKIEGFSYAKQVWSGSKPRPAANPDRMLESQYHPTGTLEPWLVASKMITDQKRPEFDAILAAAFAAPLVTCVGQTGLLMSCYSPESGIGKSTALQVAQAVWGHPVQGMQSLGDTQNSVVKKLGALHNLPVFWDELKTDQDHAKFVSLAFQLAQGKEKSRMSSDTAFREIGTWETMLVSASNDSLINYISSKTTTTSAGLARVFEFRVRPGNGQGRIDIGRAQQIVSALHTNFGNAGLVYAKMLGRDHEAVWKETTEVLLEFEKQFLANPEERFWLAVITCVVMGARLANRLKLTEIDEPNLRRFMIDQYNAMRAERKTAPVDITNPEAVLNHLSRFLNEKRHRNTVITDRMWLGTGRPPTPPANGHVILRMDPNHRLEAPEVHIAETGHIRIMRAAFVAWMREHDLSDRLILSELQEQFGVVEGRARLGVGTAFQTQMEPVLDFDLHHQGFATWRM